MTITKTKDETIIELFTQLSSLLPGYIAPDRLTSREGETRLAIAKAYADKSFREYIAKKVNAEMESMIHVTDLGSLYLKQGKIQAFKEIIYLGEQCYKESKTLKLQ